MSSLRERCATSLRAAPAQAPIIRRAALALLGVAIPAFAGQARAQTRGDTPVEEVVVTATRSATSVDRIGSSVTVVTGVDLERQQSRYLNDALQKVPGVAVSQHGSRGTTSSVRLRGQGGEDTLVLVDGIEVSDPSQPQTTFDFAHMTTAGIERVEVLRGSQSVLYGGDAVGGVISISTQRGAGRPQGTAELEAGTFGSRVLGASVAGGARRERLTYSFNVQRIETDGFSAADENLPGNTEGEAYDATGLNGVVTYAATAAVEFTGAFRAAEGTRNYDACGGPFCDDPDRGDDFEQRSVRVAAEMRPGPRLTAKIGAALARTERHGFNDGAPSGAWLGERDKLDFAGTFTLAGTNGIVFGAEFEDESMSTTSIGRRRSVGIDGYYAMYQVSPTDSLHLTFGGRLDRHEAFGSFDTYRATAAYAIGESGIRLKASASTGFRAPSLFELFGVAFGESLGNGALEPEESESFDIGIETTTDGDRGRFGVTYFRIETDNEIRFDNGAFGNGSAPNFFNIGTTRSAGLEFAGDWILSDRVSLGVSYTYNEAENELGQPLDNRPRHVVAVALNYGFRAERGNLNVSLRHVADTVDTDSTASPQRTVVLEEGFVANVAARVRIVERLELSLRVENLFDEQYQTEFGYGAADRAVYAGIRYRY